LIIPDIPVVIPGTVVEIIKPLIDDVKPPIENIRKPSSSTITAFTKDTSSETLPKDTSKFVSTGSGAGNDTSGTKKSGIPIGPSGGGSAGSSGYEKDSVVSWVPEMPEYPGGMSALYKFISQKMRTNNQWRENGSPGKVVYEFVVGRDGKIRDQKIFYDEVKYGVAELNLGLFTEMLRWKPGRNNGHEVSVMYRLPVKFEKE
jgi:protein TonB